MKNNTVNNTNGIVNYSHDMSIENVWKYAHYNKLNVNPEELEELLLYVYNIGLENGYGFGKYDSENEL